MRALRAELRSPLAASKPAAPRAIGGRYDFPTLAYRKPEKLSPWVCLQLIVATSAVLWIAAAEVIGRVQ